LPLTTEFMLTLVWVSSSVLLAAAIVYRDGNFGNLNVIAMFSGYHAVPSGAGGMSTPKRTTPRHPSGREPASNTDAFNMFDPADLPPRLAEYANMVYSACEDLGNFFGFQDSSVRNQAEHLLILLSNNRRYMSSHILPPSVQLARQSFFQLHEVVPCHECPSQLFKDEHFYVGSSCCCQSCRGFGPLVLYLG
jgi:callose synthase